MNVARIAQLFRLALFDLRHEWAITLCQIASVAAVLAPLLVLYGLQQGVIGTLLERMNRDPAMRAIIPDVAGSNRSDAEWFEMMPGDRPGGRLPHADDARHRRAGGPAAEEWDRDGAGARVLAADRAWRPGCRRRTGRSPKAWTR